MSFNWRDYLALANNLIRNEPSEVGFRAAISRAYYAAFNVLRIRAGYNTPSEQRDISHQSFIKALQEKPETFVAKFQFIDESDLKAIGNELEFLRLHRNISDYDGLKAITAKNAMSAVEKVASIFALLDDSGN